MRFAALVPLVAVLGCGNKSKLDAGRGADVDALWELAPDGTEVAVVASPRAVGLGFRTIGVMRELVKEPDFAPAKQQLDAIAKGMFGSEDASPEDAGFASDKAFAVFATRDGVLVMMPVGDRDKFMAAKNGTRGTTEDTIEGNTCRPIGKHYMCATQVAMFDRVGKGSLRGKLVGAGARGDAELYMSGLPLFGANKGELLLAAQLDPGQVSLYGNWIGEPDGLMKDLAGLAAPKPDTKGASGFVALNVKPLLGDAPAVPVAGDVTLEQVTASLVGTLTAVIPAGTVDIQIAVPLTDPKPLQTVIEHCPDVEKFFTLAQTQTPGACRIVLQGTSALELDAWVEGNALRLGSKKGPPPAGKPGAMTDFGRELGDGTWAAAFWGRGTMLNLTGITPSSQEVPREVALGIHAIALVNELGAGVKVDTSGVRFRAKVRTAWANPPNVVDRVVKIEGNDILTGKATEPAKAIATSAPGSPFAADFEAGQGGLMIPAAAIGLASAIVIPQIMRVLGGGGGGTEEVPTDMPPPQDLPPQDLPSQELAPHELPQ